MPFKTIVNSSNSGVCPGSTHPPGLRMWATLVVEVLELTRPMYSSISFGLLPAASIRVGWEIRVGMDQTRRSASSRVRDSDYNIRRTIGPLCRSKEARDEESASQRRQTADSSLRSQ